MTLTVGSLFAGIGGLELGLERAGMKTIWQVECDAYARKVLEKHWPNVARFDDVRTVGAHNLEPVDLICGGFPCQDISIAGKGAGLAGERSGLWSEFRRLIGELRPRFVLVENVSALLVRGLGDVLGDLAALGYDAEWDCIPAAAVGAPHRRDRLFIVAYANGESERFQSKSEPGGRTSSEPRDDGTQGPVANSDREHGGQGWSRRSLVNGQSGSDESAEAVAHADRERLEGQRDVARIFSQEVARVGRSSWWATEPDVGRVAHGVSARVDRLRCLGNAVVPQVAEFIGRRIMEAA
jgi:DNA (cytosine-5)-methyltransferase 1